MRTILSVLLAASVCFVEGDRIISQPNFDVDVVYGNDRVQVSLLSQPCYTKFMFVDVVKGKELSKLIDFINKQFPAGYFSRNSCIVEKKVVDGTSVKAKVEEGLNGALYFYCGNKVANGEHDYEAILEFFDSSKLPQSCSLKGWRYSSSACGVVAQNTCKKALSIRISMYGLV